MALVFYSLLFPTFEAPDEQAHVDMVLFHDFSGLDTIDNRGRHISGGIGQAMSESMFTVDPRPRGQSWPYDERSTFAELDAYQSGPGGGVNYTQQTPSFYYYVLAAESRLILAITPGEPSYDMHVWILRLLSGAFLVPLPWLLGRSAREIGGGESAEQAAMFTPLLFPQLLHIGGAVNNDDLVLLASAATLLGGLRILRGSVSSTTVALAGLGLGLAVFTKASALVLVPCLAGASLYSWLRLKTPLKPHLITGLLAFLSGGWFYARNLIGDGTLLREVEPSLYAENPAFEASFSTYIDIWVPWIMERYVGWFGWFDVRTPAWVYYLVLGFLLVSVLAAMPSSRTALWVGGVIPAILGIGVLLQANYGLYASIGLTAGIQGRYLFASTIGLWALAGVGAAAVVRSLRLGERGAVLVLAIAAVANFVAIRRILDAYWGGESMYDEFRTMAAYTPVSATLTTLIVLLTGLVLLAAGAAAFLATAPVSMSDN
ncbi:MAG: small subunit ribosomal protein S36 [Acidimicrobiales bacterium]|jgi:small subunit ribosomal protein S36